MSVKKTEISKEQKTANSQQLLNRFVKLYQEFIAAEDGVTAMKMGQLIKKLHEKEFIIGFCGHFSAGKSSMINYLMNESLLPSSPIPTSANLVKVKSGREYARVFYRDSDPIEYEAPYDYDQIKTYCRDGDSIESIEISHASIDLPEGVSIMDTPGIDSTDERHIMATESALHLADIIFYMMDYNHVQSEVNFLFTKMLKTRQKEVYLIINQIDKHDRSELKFSDFKQSVQEAFKGWGVYPDGIFYTSLVDSDHPENEVESIKKLIEEKVANRAKVLSNSAAVEAEQLVSEHIQVLNERDEEKLEAIDTILRNETTETVIEQITEAEEQLQQVQEYVISAEVKFKQECQTVLKNAYLMPFETRELARSFLESMQPGFQKGLFFRRSKTEQIQLDRLTAFYEDLRKKAEALISWHLKDMTMRFLKEYRLHDFEVKVQNIEIHFGPELLKDTLKQGAGFNGDYLLTYTEDVAEQIKKLYRKTYMELLDLFIAKLVEESKLESDRITEQLQQLKSVRDVAITKEKIISSWKDRERELSRFLQEDVEIPEGRLIQLMDELYPKFNTVQSSLSKDSTVEAAEDPLQVNHEEAEFKRDSTSESLQATKTFDLNKTGLKLQQVAELIDTIPGTKVITGDLRKKAEKLINNRFTTALFGAFSAGKSSFANALLGEMRLPVSPNPTTATINKILPPTSEFPHGTIHVFLKSKEHLLEDLRASLAIFNEQANSIEESLEIIERFATGHEREGKEKTHLLFLNAVKAGYRQAASLLGKRLDVSDSEYLEFAVQEEKACFVESIELYINCPFTERGMILVDTPGADSINARHTDVAFDYIKNADAILFVTYYNHAFSRADREFLIQLGRVKDSFELDKMFFILNAADLAKTQEELLAVKAYVTDQLNQYGIRNPKLFSLSSKQALLEKQKKIEAMQSGIVQFEQAFDHFVMKELNAIAIQSADQLLLQSTEMVTSVLNQALESKDVKERKRKELDRQREKIQSKIIQFEPTFQLKALEKEVDELVYYVNKRIDLRMNDLFLESFNPSVLRDDVKAINRVLEGCMRELIESIGFDLAQEMRATSLRVEKFLKNQLEDSAVLLQQKVSESQFSIPIVRLEEIHFDTLHFDPGVTTVAMKTFKPALLLYKNAKTFFEKNEKMKMREKIKELLQSPIKSYLDEEKERITLYYQKQFKELFNELKYHAEGQVTEYFIGLRSALSEDVNPNAIREIQYALEEIIHS